MRTIVLLIALLAVAVTPTTAQQKVRVTGMFSDMHYIADAGDVLGTEVFIAFTSKGYWAVVQMAEGVPDIPVVVPVTIKGTDVSFILSDKLTFAGTVTPTALVGTLGYEKVSLRRGKSYWQ
jgi:hypothetical protein